MCIEVTHKLLSIVIGEELLQLDIPVMPPFEDAILQRWLTHVAPPRVKIPSIVRSSGIDQEVKTVHTETPGG